MKTSLAGFLSMKLTGDKMNKQEFKEVDNECKNFRKAYDIPESCYFACIMRAYARDAQRE